MMKLGRPKTQGEICTISSLALFQQLQRDLETSIIQALSIYRPILTH